MPPEMSDVHITPVILAGGRGSRLWPLASETRPKPFLKLLSRRSLLQKTLQRMDVFSSPVLVTEVKNNKILERQLRQIDIHPSCIVYEPVGRNTAAAVLSAAVILRDENPLLLICPSDQVIGDTQKFTEQIAAATRLHRPKTITVLGINPRSANPRFGYIVPEKGGVQVREFVEKPVAKKARALIAEEGALWHSGLFLCYAQDICHFADDVAGNMLSRVLSAVPSDLGGLSVCLEESAYRQIPSISIDYALLEQVKCCFVRKIDVEWHDVGTWTGLMRAVRCLKG